MSYARQDPGVQAQREAFFKAPVANVLRFTVAGTWKVAWLG